MRAWDVETRGGDFDGREFAAHVAELPLVLIAWFCGPACDGHATFNVQHPGIVLRSATAYDLTEVDDLARSAVYEIGECLDDLDDRQSALAGMGDYVRRHGLTGD